MEDWFLKSIALKIKIIMKQKHRDVWPHKQRRSETCQQPPHYIHYTFFFCLNLIHMDTYKYEIYCYDYTFYLWI